MAFTEALFVIVGLLVVVYVWAKHSHTYWQRKGVPYVKPTLFIGNTKEMFTMKTSFGLHISEVYQDPAMQNEAVVGIYTLNNPSLVIRDTELLKSMLIKDFNKFSNRNVLGDPHGDALGNCNLFVLRNPYWKDLRSKLSPLFTSGKIKQMYPLMLEVAADLESHLARKDGSEKKFTSEIREICSLFTTDIIASIAFGLRANSLQNPNAEFRKQGRKHFNFTIWRSFEFFVAFFLPKLVSVLKIKIFSKEFSTFLRESINFVMKEREQNGTVRNDLIDILISLKKEATLEQAKHHYAKDNDFLVAQAATFLLAGFETSSSTMTFALYELAKNPELGNRLRQEIHEALIAENGNLSYEKIHNMEYLSMVVDETLRLYPVLPFLDRQYEDASGTQKYSLKPHYNYELENGMPVYIPVFGLQRDPKYWTEPNTFNPERFSPENKKNINSMAYMPFGVGPHNCIGSRIGLLQTKIGLVHFLKNHFVQPCAKTVSQIKFDPKAFVLQSKSGVHLEVVYDGLYDNEVSSK